MASADFVPLLPLSTTERDVVSRIVDGAPALRPALVAELSALLGGAL